MIIASHKNIFKLIFLYYAIIKLNILYMHPIRIYIKTSVLFNNAYIKIIVRFQIT